MKKNILVTGAGAVLGQGILRSLNIIAGGDLMIHSADPDFRSTGHWLAHKAHTIPMAADPGYIARIKDIIRENAIDIVMIGTDTELPLFAASKAELEAATPVKIVVSDSHAIDIANDKWKTADFLKKNGFDFPRSVMAADSKAAEKFRSETQLPYFAKPVDGARSKGIVAIHTEEEFKSILSQPGNLVIQEFLRGEEGEFTTGCLVVNGKCKAIVTLRRDLRDGNTYRAYYERSFGMYNDFIAEVAEKLGVDGPCNFQFRLRNGRPVIFEINARFSGTTPIRFMFGFNEVEAILNHLIHGTEIRQPELNEGMVLRAWSDLFVSSGEIERFRQAGPVDSPHATHYPFHSA